MTSPPINEKIIPMAPWISKRDPNLCQDCQYCRKWVYRYESCIDCCACHFSCSYCAVKMEERASWETITIHFAGKPLRVPSGISVKEALELSGYPISPFPKGDRIFVPCEVGSVSNNRKGRDGTDSFKKFQYLLSICCSQALQRITIWSSYIQLGY